MKTLKITIEYDGTDFCGWQLQENLRSVQEVLQNAMAEALGCPVELEASGRTDKGVHARAQVCSFTCDKKFEYSRLPMAVNYLLPADVSMLTCEEMPETFNARFSAKKKTYEFCFFVNRIRSPLRERYALRIPLPVDIEKMKRAGKLFEGEHDFSSFAKAKKRKENCVRTVFSCDVEKDGDLYKIVICGNGFLHNMVRIIAGTILRVGQGKLDESVIPEILAGKNRTLAGKTLAPHALFLKSVDYD